MWSARPIVVVCLLLIPLAHGCQTAHGGTVTGRGPAGDPLPGDYGRPAIVRGFARTGTWLGVVPGIVATIALYPLTKGLELVWDEPFGYSPGEWTLVPLTGCAAAGHALIGLPAEALYQLGHGLWIDRPPPPQFDDPGRPGAATGSPR